MRVNEGEEGAGRGRFQKDVRERETEINSTRYDKLYSRQKDGCHDDELSGLTGWLVPGVKDLYLSDTEWETEGRKDDRFD